MPDRRIIAIAVSPRAYDEILKLKGKVTWTDFTLRAVNALVGSNAILEEEIANLPRPKPFTPDELKTIVREAAKELT